MIIPLFVVVRETTALVLYAFTVDCRMVSCGQRNMTPPRWLELTAVTAHVVSASQGDAMIR